MQLDVPGEEVPELADLLALRLGLVGGIAGLAVSITLVHCGSGC